MFAVSVITEKYSLQVETRAIHVYDMLFSVEGMSVRGEFARESTGRSAIRSAYRPFTGGKASYRVLLEIIPCLVKTAAVL